MANDFVQVDTTKRLGGKLRTCIDSTTTVLAIMSQLKQIMDHQTDGVTYTEIEQQFGLDAGDGIVVYNLLAGALAACNVSATQQFVYRVG